MLFVKGLHHPALESTRPTRSSTASHAPYKIQTMCWGGVECSGGHEDRWKCPFCCLRLVISRWGLYIPTHTHVHVYCGLPDVLSGLRKLRIGVWCIVAARHSAVFWMVQMDIHRVCGRSPSLVFVLAVPKRPEYSALPSSMYSRSLDSLYRWLTETATIGMSWRRPIQVICMVEELYESRGGYQRLYESRVGIGWTFDCRQEKHQLTSLLLGTLEYCLSCIILIRVKCTSLELKSKIH